MKKLNNSHAHGQSSFYRFAFPSYVPVQMKRLSSVLVLCYIYGDVGLVTIRNQEAVMAETCRCVLHQNSTLRKDIFSENIKK